MIGSRCFSGIFGTLLLTSCSLGDDTQVEHEGGSSVSHIQAHSHALRAAEHQGSRLSFDFRHSNRNGAALSCRELQLKVQVEYAKGGLDGVFYPVPDHMVRVSCDDKTPFNLGIVVDNSGSQIEAIEEIKRGAQGLAEDVISAGGQVSLTRVSTQASSLVGLTQDLQVFSEALSKTRVNRGWTALYDGIRLASEGLGEQALKEGDQGTTTCHRSRRTALAVFTDGADNNSADEKNVKNTDGIDTSIEDLIDTEHWGTKVPVFTIGMGDKVNQDVLTKLAKATGGMFMSIQDQRGVGQAFEQISESLRESVEVCAELPSCCGPLGVRVTYTYQKNGETVTEQESYETQVACKAPAPRGRVVTVMMALSDPSLPEHFRRTLVSQSMDWVAQAREKRVLLVLDDHHHGEHPREIELLRGDLESAGYRVDVLHEQGCGLKRRDLSAYQLLWFTNPGYPVDDLRSLEALRSFVGAGGGLVISGDDLTRAAGRGFKMSPLTGLQYRSNGVVSCGLTTNDGSNDGFALHRGEVQHPITQGLDASGVVYRNDIDHSSVVDSDAQVLLWGRVSNGDCQVATPVVVARDF